MSITADAPFKARLSAMRTIPALLAQSATLMSVFGRTADRTAVMLSRPSRRSIVQLTMFGARHELQVFCPVVVLNFVHMVHDFIRREVTPDAALHDQPMLIHESIGISGGMMRRPNKNVSPSCLGSPTLPCRVTFTRSRAGAARQRTVPAITFGEFPRIDVNQFAALFAGANDTLGVHRNQAFRCRSGAVTSSARFPYSQANFITGWQS